MKKYLLLLLMPLLLVACNNDDDIPSVNLTLKIDNVSVYNDVVYMVKGRELTVNSLTVTPNNNHPSALGSVAYYWDHHLVLFSDAAPYSATLLTAGEPIGRHLFQISSYVYQEDKTIMAVNLSYPVVILEDPDDLPGGAPAIGEATLVTGM